VASRRRGFRRGGGRRKRPVDWVTTPGAWDWGLPPILIPDGSLTTIPLTCHADLIDPTGTPAVEQPSLAAQYRIPQLEQTCVRVVGAIWFWILPTTAWWDTLTGVTHLIARITVEKQVVGLTSAIPSTADITGVRAGNVNYMHEEVHQFVAQAAWGDMVVDPTMYVHEMKVDTSVQRRLRQNDVVALELQYGPGLDYAGDAEAFPDLAVNVRLRTLVRTLT